MTPKIRRVREKIDPGNLPKGVFMAFSQSNRLRAISYNIFEGMRLDTSAGRPIFVQWVKLAKVIMDDFTKNYPDH